MLDQTSDLLLDDVALDRLVLLHVLREHADGHVGGEGAVGRLLGRATVRTHLAGDLVTVAVVVVVVCWGCQCVF